MGEDYGAGASVIQERTHAFALKSSLILFDPRPSLQTWRAWSRGLDLRGVKLPAVISLRIRAAHMQGSMVCKDNVRPAISTRDRLQRHSFDYSRISHPPSTYTQEAQKFEKRLPAARRYVLERGLNEVIAGEEKELGIILQGGLTPTALRALLLLGRADVFGRSRIPILVLNVIHPLVPEQLLDFLEGKRRVLVLEEGMPNFIEQELKALAYDRDSVSASRGTQGTWRPRGVRARGRARSARRASRGRCRGGTGAVSASRPGAARDSRAPLPKRPPAFCTGCPERPMFSALKIAQRRLGETTWRPTSAATPSPRCRHSTRAIPSWATAWDWPRRDAVAPNLASA